MAEPLEQEEPTSEETEEHKKVEPAAVESFSPRSPPQPQTLSHVLPSLTGFPDERLSLLGEVIKKFAMTCG